MTYKEIEQLVLNDKTKEAKELLFEIINSNSDVEPRMYLLLGSVYAIENNNQLALQYFSRAYDLEPSNYEFIQTISNFLVTNGDKSAANELLSRYMESYEQNENIVDTQEEQAEFDYMDFILGGGDALSYKIDSTSNNSKPKYQPKSVDSVKGFNYAELITNDDINDILTKYNISPLEKGMVVPEIPNKKASAKPKMLFTMYGWNEQGGGTKLPKSVISELANRGYDVAVFYATAIHPTNTTPYYMEKTIYNGVKLYGVYNRPTILFDYDNPLREICDGKIIALFNSVIDEFLPNIVNFNNFVGLSFEMASVVKHRGIVSTFTTHNYHLIDPKLYIYDNNLVPWKSTNFFENSDLPNRHPNLINEYKMRMDKAKSILLNEIDYTLAVSSRVKQLLTEFSENPEVAANRIAVINQIPKSIEPLLDNPTKPHSLSDKLRFTFIGDGIPHKGAHIIAQALQFLSNKSISVDFWGNFDNDYGKAIKSIDKHNVISMRGAYTSKDLKKIAENSDCLIVSSICEDCAPLVLVEGLAMNTPIIASRVGGIEDFVIDGYNGMLYKSASPKALAAVMNYLVENPFKVDNMRLNCKVPYSFNDYVSHLESIFNRLANGERPAVNELELPFRNALKEKE